MPCTVYENEHIRFDKDQLMDEVSRLKREVNEVTNLLCSVCKVIEAGDPNPDKEQMQKVYDWYKQHKMFDDECKNARGE